MNVSRLVEDSFELLKLMVSKHAKLEFRLAADAPQVRANPGTLRQALINLVTNASEAIGERDGVIHVSTARVSIGPAVNGHELLAGDYVQLAISDTGGGIPQASQARIFDPFFTTKSSGSRPRSRVGNREAPRRGYHR